MKIKLIILILFFLLILSKSIYAQDKWTTENTIMEITYITLNIMDWGQTLDISKNPDKFIETNIILGKHPKQSGVNLYFLTVNLLHPIIMYYLPEKHRGIIQFISIGLSGQTVLQNYNLGLKINF